nr:hypothetical protein [Tanacetum cinerariifolium]
MLAPGNYVQWKSRIKRYIDTKPNHELIHHCLKNPPYKFMWADMEIPISKGSPVTRTESQMETYKTVSQDKRYQLNAKAKAVQIILIGIDNDIYSTVDACPNACEMWKAIERLKQGESINVQDLETNLYWKFGKFTSHDDESLELYYSRFVTLVKQSQEIKAVSYHKLYDILKQHQNEVNEIKAERIVRVVEIDTQEKDKNKAKNDKTEHKIEKIEKDKVIRSQKVKSQSPRGRTCQNPKHFTFTIQTTTHRPQLKSNPMGDRVMHNNSQGKKQEVEDQHRNVKLSKNKTSITACNDSLNAKALNANSMCATCDQCVLNDKHAMRVLNSIAKSLKKTVSSESNQKPRNITRKLYEHVRVDNTKTRRPQPRSNTKHDRVPSTSKSSQSKNKETEVEEHYRNLMLSKNNKHMSSTCNNIKFDFQNVISKVVCAICYPDLFVVRRLGLFQAHDRKSNASHQFCLEVYRNCLLQK